MTIALNVVVVRHERRLRLLFSEAVAAGAFTSVAWYTVTAPDGDSPAPLAVAAYSVTGSPAAVDIHLDGNLTQGGLYAVAAVGVPALAGGGGSTPSPSLLKFRVGEERGQNDLGTARAASGLESRLYGTDLVWTDDLQEAPDGDLADVSGVRVAKADLLRRVQSNGLPWRPTFGLHARQFVDAPNAMLSQIPVRAIEEATKDDRVESAEAEVVLTDDATQPIVRVLPKLIGDQLVSGIGDVQAAIG